MNILNIYLIFRLTDPPDSTLFTKSPKTPLCADKFNGLLELPINGVLINRLCCCCCCCCKTGTDGFVADD